eukprot:1190841-Prorocentrum_minimum.AAC.1
MWAAGLQAAGRDQEEFASPPLQAELTFANLGESDPPEPQAAGEGDPPDPPAETAGAGSGDKTLAEEETTDDGDGGEEGQLLAAPSADVEGVADTANADEGAPDADEVAPDA